MRKLFCGPYVGEFGWELFHWSGYCRALSRHFDETTIITRPGRSFLYEDFASVECYSPPEGGVADCENNSAVAKKEFESVIKNFSTGNESWLLPFPQDRGPYGVHWAQPVWIDQVKGFVHPEYVPRNRKSKSNNTVIIHSRNRQDVRPEDNPPVSTLEKLSTELIESGIRVVTIGQRGNSNYVPGTEDFRDKPLQEVAELMDTAICTLGTTSGPMHLASMMGCPVITWQWDYEKMWYRFSSAWNPSDSNLILIKTNGERGKFHNHPSNDQLLWAVDKIQEEGFMKMQVESWV